LGNIFGIASPPAEDFGTFFTVLPDELGRSFDLLVDIVDRYPAVLKGMVTPYRVEN
jgi:hypothetical protein